MKRTIIDRIRRYAGKDRKQVVNPNITAREAIQIADHIQEIESSLESHHRDLLAIHRVAACVAHVEPITEDDTLTVKRVKQMAMLINQSSPVHEVEPCGVWQFFQHGEWNVGSNLNNHRQNTEDAGIPTRDLYTRELSGFTDEEQELLMEAIDLAQDELHNQVATCPDVNMYAGEISDLREKQKSLAELKGRMHAFQVANESEVNPRLPPVNWEGYYTKKGVTENWFEGKPRWYWCVVVAHDQGKAVVRTRKGHYHAHSPDEFEFNKEPEGYRG